MSGFGSILKRGRKMFNIKDAGGKWQRCEECDEMRKCFNYVDEREEIWVICEECMKEFVKDET